MLTYPVLNGQPIDQLNFEELKDELCRRNLHADGLKDDLLKRLFEELQGDILAGEGPVGGPPPDVDLKEEETPGSADSSVCQAAMEQNVDAGPSQVATPEGDPVVSVTEVSEKSADATKEVIQDDVVDTGEVIQTTPAPATDVSDAPPVDMATFNEISPSDAVAANEDHLESAPSGSNVVKEVSPQADCHSEIIAEKAPEEGTIKKVIANYLPCYVASTDVNFDAISAKGKTGRILPATVSTCQPIDQLNSAELKDEPCRRNLHANGWKDDEISPSVAVAANGDHLESASCGSNVVKEASPQADHHSDTIAEKSPEKGTIKEVNANYLPCDVASNDVKLDATSAKGKLDADIVEQDAVSSPPDASLSHVDPLNVDAVAAAPGQNAETLIPMIDSGDNSLMNSKGHGGSRLTNHTSNAALSGMKDQVSEDDPDDASLQALDKRKLLHLFMFPDLVHYHRSFVNAFTGKDRTMSVDVPGARINQPFVLSADICRASSCELIQFIFSFHDFGWSFGGEISPEDLFITCSGNIRVLLIKWHFLERLTEHNRKLDLRSVARLISQTIFGSNPMPPDMVIFVGLLENFKPTQEAAVIEFPSLKHEVDALAQFEQLYNEFLQLEKTDNVKYHRIADALPYIQLNADHWKFKSETNDLVSRVLKHQTSKTHLERNISRDDMYQFHRAVLADPSLEALMHPDRKSRYNDRKIRFLTLTPGQIACMPGPETDREVFFKIILEDLGAKYQNGGIYFLHNVRNNNQHLVESHSVSPAPPPEVDKFIIMFKYFQVLHILGYCYPEFFCSFFMIMHKEELVQRRANIFHENLNAKALEANTIVLVHGGGFGAWCWHHTVPFLEDSGFKVKAIDLTGSGAEPSDANRITSLQEYAKPLTSYLEGLDDDEKVILVGHDSGGACLSHAMEMFPSKVSKAIFVCATMLSNGHSILDIFQQQMGTNDMLLKAQDLVCSNGMDRPPTAIKIKKASLTDLLFNQSPAKDVSLASVSMRPIPFAPVMEKLVLTEENYGSVRRFFVETTEDKTIPLPLQQIMCMANPPEKVLRLKGSDHAPFFSKPLELQEMLVEIAVLR